MTSVRPPTTTASGPLTTEGPTQTTTTEENLVWYKDIPILIGVIVAGAVVLLTIFIVIGCVCCRKKRRRRPQQTQAVRVQRPVASPHAPQVIAHGPPGTGTVVVNPQPMQGYAMGPYPGQQMAGPRPPGPGPHGPHGPPRQMGPRPQGPMPGPPPGYSTMPRPPGHPGPNPNYQGPRGPNNNVGYQKHPGTMTLPAQPAKKDKLDGKYPALTAMERNPSIKNTNHYIKFEVPAPTDNEKPLLSAVPVDSKIEEMARLLSRSIAKTLDAINIDPDKIKRQDVLGAGQYGVVYKGEYIQAANKSTALVALKTIAGDASDDKDMTDFMDEILRMKSFSHDNVMPMLGMTILDNKPYMVLPFMQYGDLKSYISKKDRTFLVEDLLRVCLQVTRGMHYLASQNIIHGDLAARNCMVGKEGKVKVADFGLSRHLMQSNYYSFNNSEQLRPIRWMAPECIKEQKYSSKSDVWSFGILTYEVMTRGQRPYPEIKSNEEVVTKLKEGYRMPCPVYTAEEIYEIMGHCWSEDPANRPRFNDLTEQVMMLIEQAGADYELPLNVADLGPQPEVRSYVVPSQAQ